jgi:fatty acid desaturase
MTRPSAVSGGKPTLGSIRQYLVTILAVVVMLRIVLWAIIPFIPYILTGVVLLTVIGVALYRTTKF